FKVIQQQEPVLVTLRSLEPVQQRLRSALDESNTMGNSRDDEGGITEGSQRDKGDAIGEVVYQVPSDLKRQTRFAHARRAGEGEQAHFWAQEQRLDRLHLLLTANKLCEGDRQSRPDK